MTLLKTKKYKMKRIVTIIIMLLLLNPKISFAQDYNNPGQYMQAIQKQEENVSKRFLTYTSASAHGKRERKVEALRSKLMDEIQEARMNINSLPSYKNDKSYRDTAVSFMKFYYNVMNDDYSKIINMEEIAEQSYDDMEIYLLTEEKVQEKLKQSNDRMQEAQKRFAAANNINLLEDKSEMGAMMKEVGEMNKYYHEMYLIFFKPYIQEKHLTEAIGKNNLTGLEQSKSAMLKYAQEGLVKLAAGKGYKGDNALVRAGTSMLSFYVKEAEKSAGVNEYFLTKERFEAIKKEMDKKGDRSKEAVETFNKAVADINKSSQAYNNTMKTLNEQRTENLNNWNNSVKEFFDNHTPHYK